MPTLIERPHQSQQSPAISPEDKRLLLGASIRLLSRRFLHGKPISQDDVLRVVHLADDAKVEHG